MNIHRLSMNRILSLLFISLLFITPSLSHADELFFTESEGDVPASGLLTGTGTNIQLTSANNAFFPSAHGETKDLSSALGTLSYYNLSLFYRTNGYSATSNPVVFGHSGSTPYDNLLFLSQESSPKRPALWLDGDYYNSGETGIDMDVEHTWGFTIDDDGDLEIFVDGLSVYSASGLPDGTFTPTLFPDYGSDHFGTLSDVRIFNRGLSEAEMLSIHNGQDITDGLLVQYPMSEGWGQTVMDVSGNDHHLTFSGITAKNLWSQTGRSEAYHYNVSHGFSRYLTADSDFVHVPYELDGSVQGSEYAALESSVIDLSEHPSGYWHNYAESLISLSSSSFAQNAESSNSNHTWYNAVDSVLREVSPQAMKFDLSADGFTFADTSLPKKLKDLSLYTTARSMQQRHNLYKGWFGSDLTTTTDLSSTEVPVVIIAGQSNAVGLGAISDNPYGYEPEHSKIMLVTGSTFANLDLETNQQTEDPENYFGLETGLAYEYHNDWSSGDPDLYIIKIAVSGTKLVQDGSSTDWNVSSSGEHYDTLVSKIATARTEIENAGFTPRFLGMMWMQGESDSFVLADAQAYKTNLRNLINNLRADIAEPNLPVAIARIAGVHPALTYNAYVRYAQEEIADEDPFAVMIDTDDLGLVDNLHFDADGQLLLSRRMYAALQRLSKWYGFENSEPFITDIDITSKNQSYYVGDGVALEVTYNEPLASGSSISLNLSNGDSALLSNISSNILSGIHTLVTGTSSNDLLEFSSIASHSSTDLRSNTTTSTTTPLSELSIERDRIILAGERVVASGGGGSSSRSESFQEETQELVVKDTETTPSYCSYNARLLKVGTRGSDVQDLQEYLFAHFNYDTGGVDGIFGPKTKEAIMKLQTSLGDLDPDGIFGPLTNTRIAKNCS